MSASNCNNLGRGGSQNQAGSNPKKLAGSSAAPLQEKDPKQKRVWMQPELEQVQRGKLGISTQGRPQQVNINRVIYNKNLLHNRGGNLRGSNMNNL